MKVSISFSATQKAAVTPMETGAHMNIVICADGTGNSFRKLVSWLPLRYRRG
jgi:hypothetical protein